LKKKTLRTVLVGALSILLAATMLTPAKAAKNGTIILHEPNPLSCFNSAVVGCNLVTNSVINSLTGMGFGYYDDNRNWIQNTIFGTYKVVSNKATDFRVQYTVKPGRVWSDGTPITGIDLLLSHVIYSREYAKAAGLGDYDNRAKDPMAFNSAGIASSAYAEFSTGDPIVSADEMSVTFLYKKKFPDWWLTVIGPRPTHALVLLAEGKTGLQSVAANEAARDRFYAAYKAKSTALLKDMGKVWSTTTATDVNAATTNQLLWVGNGPFNLVSAVKGQSTTLKANPRYNSGPAVSGDIQNIVQKYVADGNPAIQALANGEITLYAGQQTADGVAALKKVTGVVTEGGLGGTYEHVDVRSGAYSGTGGSPYTGPFAGNGEKATQLRRAFLLCIPRDEIVTKLVATINPNIKPLRSVTVPTTVDPLYNRVIVANGSKYYEGDQDSKNKRALAIVKKYVPDAQTNPIKVNFLVPGNNARRAAQALLIDANMGKCGFDTVMDTVVDWSPQLRNSKYDATFFGWQASSTAQGTIRGNWRSDGSNNYNGSNGGPGLDAVLDDVFNRPMAPSVLATTFIKIERTIFGNAYTLPLYQHPAVLAYDKDLKGVKLSGLTPVKEWNFWEWKY